MCKALYISSDTPLPESQWSEASPGFYVEALKGPDSLIRQQFSKSYIYYAGAHGGCGCGFGFGDPDDVALDEEDLLGRRSLHDLFTFLRVHLRAETSIQMYFCWEGDEALQAVGVEVLDLDRFSLPHDTYYLPERTLINVVHA
jgi:hypothetical protein